MKLIVALCTFYSALIFATIEDSLIVDVVYEGQQNGVQSTVEQEVLIVPGDANWKKIGIDNTNSVWLKLNEGKDNEVTLGLKVIQQSKDQEKEVVIASPKIKTILGTEAEIETNSLKGNSKQKFKILVQKF